jgi:hypothetical protein
VYEEKKMVDMLVWWKVVLLGKWRVLQKVVYLVEWTAWKWVVWLGY